jgi:hypothetical protein
MAAWRFLTTSTLCAARAHLTTHKALRLLVTEGLAEVSPGMGFYVRTGIGQI